MKSCYSPCQRTAQGITLIEVMVVLAIIGILAAVTLPLMSDYFRNQRVRGAVENYYASLQNAKFSSSKTNALISIQFTPGTTNTTHTAWCYGMTTAASTSCDCSASPNTCESGSVMASSNYPDVTVNFNANAKRSFSPVRNDAAGTQGTTTFTNGSKSLGVKVSTYGRVIICRPTGSTVSGYTDSETC